MKNLFTFDVTLKDLMNLASHKSNKVGIIFKLLENFWYSTEDRIKDSDRWNNVRIGHINVYLDKSKALHLDFETRFTFEKYPEAIEILEKVKEDDPLW